MLSDLFPGAIVAASIAPAILLLWLVVAADGRPEPPRVVAACVFLGALSTLPAGLIERWLQGHIPIFQNFWVGAYEFALLIAGLPEETLKISIESAMKVHHARRCQDQSLDSILHTIALPVSLPRPRALIAAAYQFGKSISLPSALMPPRVRRSQGGP